MVRGKLLLEEGVALPSEWVVVGDIQVFHAVQVVVSIIQPTGSMVNIIEGISRE